MLRAARAAPTSPSRSRQRQPTASLSPWNPSIPIRFAPESIQHTRSTTAEPAQSKGWQPGDPILFDQRGNQPQPSHQVQNKGKGKQAASVDQRRSPPVSPARTSINTTQATISSSPRFSLLSNTTSNTSTQSWGLLSHRWEPPSPSLSSTSLADRSTSTMRFSPSRSYARLSAASGTGELRRPESPFRGGGAEMEEMLEVEFGSFTGAMDEFGNGKVDMGVQAGTPWARRKARGERDEMSHSPFPFPSPMQPVQLGGSQLPPVLSQAQVDDLLEGIDFDDEMDLEFELSVSEGNDSAASFHSALDSPLPLSLPKASPPPPPRSPNFSLRTRHPRHAPPSPLSDNLEEDLFSPQPIPHAQARRAHSPPPRHGSPISASSFYPPPLLTASRSNPGAQARAFSTSAPREELSREEMMAALEAEAEEGVSSEIEFLEPRRATAAARREVETLVLSEEEGDSEEVEILPPPSSSRIKPPSSIATSKPTSTSTAVPPKPSSSSGWFTKPSPSTSTSVPAPSRPAPRARPPPKEGTLAYKKALAASRKAEATASLRAQYPRDFRWERWGVKRARMIYSRDEEEVERVVRGMKGPLGFDLEWEPSTRRGVENKTAVVQLCDEETILIVHLAQMKRFPPLLKAVLEDPEIIKLGVQIAGDARKLTRDYPGFAPRGLLELNNVAKTVDPDRFKGQTGLVGLQKLVGVYLDHYLSKEGGVRMGKWGEELGEEQLYYAANDVFSSLHVFLALQSLAAESESEGSTSSASYLYHVSSNISTASSFRPPLKPSGLHALPSHNAPLTTLSTSPGSSRRLSPTPRQLEAYTLFHTSTLPIDEVALQMEIKPLSVVWGLLNCLSTVEGSEFEIDERRVLEAVEEVGGVEVHRRMAEEGREVLERCRERLRERGVEV
ncbi:hypothetical protein BCR35DRAFT_300578 [Leucosporidium creatinivorum]|uniref:3'-5' exonuclease domain-containing protein n=1 Tax=Leucosporidium creatinivorum TaxID=106004 RepID=A0A1Y2FZ48_9BASI|nr:hypothetical protein BCR35DRAFT_300578 [Leucosporidium creatinivorum]